MDNKNEFYELAARADVRVTIDSYMAYEGGKESMQLKINSLKQEIKRLQEIITERNHEMGLG